MKQKILNLLLTLFEQDEILELSDPRLDDKHFKLSIKSAKFNNLSRIERSRTVYALIQELLDSGELHAISMDLKSLTE